MPRERRRSTSRTWSKSSRFRRTTRYGSTRSTSTSSIWRCWRCCRYFTRATCAGTSGSSASCQARQGVLADRDQCIGRRPTVARIDVDDWNVVGQRQRLAHLGNRIRWGAVELVDRDEKWHVAVFEEVDRGEAVLQAPTVNQDDRADCAAHQVVPHEPESALPRSAEQVKDQIFFQRDPAEVHRYRGGPLV